MLKKILIPLVILALGVAGYYWLNKPASPVPAQTPSANPQAARGGMMGGLNSGQVARQGATSVDVMPAQANAKMAQLKLFGVVTANQQIDITATSNATVVAILVREGQLVEQGQVLAELRSDATQQTLVQRKAALDELNARIRNEQRKHDNDKAALTIDEELLRIAQNTVDRFTSLTLQQLSTSTDYENALRSYQAQLQQVQARRLLIAQYPDVQRQLAAQQQQLSSQIEVVEQQVNELTLSAPFTGVVAKLAMVSGQEIRTGMALATLYNPEQLEIIARSPLRYRLDQYPLASLTATSKEQIWTVSAVRPLNEMGAQQIAFSAADPLALMPLPGSHIELMLSYPLPVPAVEIPVTALYDQQRVYLANRGQLQAASVNIVGRSETGYLVTSDAFNEQAMIVTTRINNPTTGMPVSVLDRTGARR